MLYMLDQEESERLYFRLLEEKDFADWLMFFKHPDTSKYLAFPSGKAPEELCSMWFDKVFTRYREGKGGMNVLIDKESGKMVGQCGLLINRVDEIDELEVGYSLLPEFWGKGFASEAAIKCKEFAFQNSFSESLISIIHPDNKPSINVAMRNGMEYEKHSIFCGMPANIYRVYKCSN